MEVVVAVVAYRKNRDTPPGDSNCPVTVRSPYGVTPLITTDDGYPADAVQLVADALSSRMSGVNER